MKRKKIIFIFILILILPVFLLSCEDTNKVVEIENISVSESTENNKLVETETESEIFMYDIQEIKKYITENTLDTIPNGFREFSCIAAIPEKDIYLYGYNNGGCLLLKYQDKYEAFNYYWLTPRMVLPEMYLYDYDANGKEELAVKLYQASGTKYEDTQRRICNVTPYSTSCALSLAGTNIFFSTLHPKSPICVPLSG
jgi:hypothetical protein